MADRVYLSRLLQTRIRALGLPIRPFVRDAVAARLAEFEARSKVPVPAGPPEPPTAPELTAAEIAAMVDALQPIDFSDLRARSGR